MELNGLYCSPNVIGVKKKMGGACGMYGGQERCMKGFGGESRAKETTWNS